MRAAREINSRFNAALGLEANDEKSHDVVCGIAELIDRETGAKELAEALRMLLNTYVGLVNSGDGGHWDPENDCDVINARAALAEFNEGTK